MISTMAGLILPSANGVDWLRRKRFGARAVLTLDLEKIGLEGGPDAFSRVADVVELAGHLRGHFRTLVHREVVLVELPTLLLHFLDQLVSTNMH